MMTASTTVNDREQPWKSHVRAWTATPGRERPVKVWYVFSCGFGQVSVVYLKVFCWNCFKKSTDCAINCFCFIFFALIGLFRMKMLPNKGNFRLSGLITVYQGHVRPRQSGHWESQAANPSRATALVTALVAWIIKPKAKIPKQLSRMKQNQFQILLKQWHYIIRTQLFEWFNALVIVRGPVKMAIEMLPQRPSQPQSKTCEDTSIRLPADSCSISDFVGSIFS